MNDNKITNAAEEEFTTEMEKRDTALCWTPYQDSTLYLWNDHVEVGGESKTIVQWSVQDVTAPISVTEADNPKAMRTWVEDELNSDGSEIDDIEVQSIRSTVVVIDLITRMATRVTVRFDVQ
ncbi:hypothetical protein [Halorubrum laminariae]|uniref:Uncharacterized protein n=1 Tax=Halorubrum laminariae TaxID=1433523 RepID=A0ABD6BYP3_9EURY|nr:hypothetical protein [Halorubrum laminariae]